MGSAVFIDTGDQRSRAPLPPEERKISHDRHRKDFISRGVISCKIVIEFVSHRYENMKF